MPTLSGKFATLLVHGAVVAAVLCLAQGAGAAAGAMSSATRAQDVCPPAPAGYAQCAAQVLRWRRDDALVRPHIRHGSFVVAARHGSLAADETLGVAPPQPSTPAYLQQAYDLSYLSATQGQSDTVAVIDAYDYPAAEADLATFRSTNGLPACTSANGCFEKVNEQGLSTPLPQTDAAWNVEEATDLDAVSALCPNCHLLMVEASSTSWEDLVTAMRSAASLGADQISDSWTSLSVGTPPGQLQFPGVSVVAATGDDGYIGSLANNYPAALPSVIAAGGTSLATATSPRGFAETAWSGAGSGCDAGVEKPAYQPSVGCSGRVYADVSADADPHTGLGVYDSGAGGWLLAGGTSLSSPLIAAFEALTHVDGTSAAWAYDDAAELNDPASGTNGICAAAITAVCLSGVGYDGPTGAGSISGAIVAGAPGIGGPDVGVGGSYVQSVTPTGATLLGGVYPNGEATSYWWEYGTTTAYGQTTAPVPVGAGVLPVSVPGALTGLDPSTTYHYRLVASNSFGTTYGFDFTLATPVGVPPQNTAAPKVFGAARVASQLRASAGAWSASGAASFVWQIHRGGRWSAIPGAHAARFVPTRVDVGHLLRVRVTETTPEGNGSATSAPAKVAARTLRRHRARRPPR
jgi:hypothetical protein